MKLLIAILFSTSAMANLHMPLDISFEESQAWYQSIKVNKQKNKYEPFVKESIDGGEKMSKWLKLINDNRDPANVIRLTSKNTQRKIPIEKPSIYGPSTIDERYNDLVNTMPEYLKNIIYGSGAITSSLNISDNEFIKWARLTSALYQTAVRWTGMKPWLIQLAARRVRDVRGYYFLKNLKDLDFKLENIEISTTDEKNNILDALERICINTGGLDDGCYKQVLKAYKNMKLLSFKNKYWNNAIRNWNVFFKIFSPRKDVEWKQTAPGVMKVVFKDPKNPTIANWLKENVEDEFRLPKENWSLEMKFIKGKWRTAYLEFKPNVTPHVTGGNKIVMDSNTPLEEYGVKWTIRHEYGHILRLPDCYHEFYIKEKNLMINYQLDTSDLMCSRAGQMNERIFIELKKAYFKK